MTAVVPESWGAYEVNHVVSGALAVARGRAMTRGEPAPRLSDVAIAVLSAPDSLAGAALTAVGIAPRDLLREGPASGGAAAEGRDARMMTLLARADRERLRARDDAIGSVHLTAALAGLDDPELAPLRAKNIDLSLLRTGVARAAADVTWEDRAFTPSPAPPVFLAPETPEVAELVNRTPLSRSAVLKQLADTRMPAGPDANATSSPYGMARGRRWGRFYVAHQALAIVTAMIALRYGTDWWLYLLLLPAFGTPVILRTEIWLAFNAAALILCPAPVAIALTLTAAAGAVSAWYELAMKRVDLGKPGTTLRDIRRATRNAGVSIVRRKLGGVDDE
ncbi:hypothetical protein ABZ388_28075 [Micromonospora parva]|uniref:hypothetical protein n=1 Tax=Micromonospora parva TaxID=1464048 RepID=UPI0033E4392E